MQWRERIDEIIGLDLRSLALFRISIALVVLYDLADRVRELSVHYTDAGVVPAATLLEIYGSRVNASVHVLASGSLAGEALVFALHASAATALLVGYRARLASALCWYLSLSLQFRVVTFLHMGGDELVACALLFGSFLPIDAYWSLDRKSGRTQAPRANRVVGVASTALIFQLCVLYWMTGWQKSGDAWTEGRAVWYLVNVKFLSSPLAHWLAEQAWAIAPLTYASLALERWGAFLLWVPTSTAALRVICVVSFSLLHIGMGLFLYIGPYPIMCIAVWLALLPGRFWDEWLPSALRTLGLADAWIPSSRESSSASLRPIGRDWFFEVVAGVLILHIVLFSAGTMRVLGFDLSTLPGIQISAGRALGMNNTWAMMSPNPGNYNWWFIVDGELASGKHADPYRNQEVSWERPENIRESIGSWRARQHLSGLIAFPKNSLRWVTNWRGFGDYLCREWNRNYHGDDRMLGGQFGWVVEPIMRFKLGQPARRSIETFRCPPT